MDEDKDIYYKLTWNPLKFDSTDGALLLFGYPLFGAWLPYIGFVTFMNDREEPMRTFIIEWFLRGIILHSNKEEDWYE
jgi:hypothetical protein|tara:strand:+ start:44 stop:277 length:234 start_codon:yes stop_codon:yes gene_type:complete